MTTALTLNDLHLLNGEPRVLDLRIAERLEMADPHDIRRTIESNRPELERYGEISGRRPENSGRGRPAIEYWLNEAQTLLLCMFSKTEKAADIRQEVIAVYLEYRQGQVPPKTETATSQDVSMTFYDYSRMMRALMAGMEAMEQVCTMKQHQLSRKNTAYVLGTLIDETNLSDEEIADRMRPVYGEYVPELVASHRRRRRKMN